MDFKKELIKELEELIKLDVPRSMTALAMVEAGDFDTDMVSTDFQSMSVTEATDLLISLT